MKDFKENKEKHRQDIKDNKLIKWTPFPQEIEHNFNFSNIPPVTMNMKCLKIFPVCIINIGTSRAYYINRLSST